MNLLLIRPEEVIGDVVVLSPRQAKHVIFVLKAMPGDSLRAGIENVGPATAEVLSIAGEVVTLRLEQPIPQARPTTTLVLAVPRPKVISRVIAAAASFGLAKLIFVNAWRVEKSYYTSPRLAPERIEEDLRLGCEQGAQCWVPEWEIWPRFTRLLEPPAGLAPEPSIRILLHPGGAKNLVDVLQVRATPAEHVLSPTQPVTLAVGPEGGWITREQESLVEAGYLPADLGTGPLKTEVAVAAVLGQLALIRSFLSWQAREKLAP